MTMMIYYSRDPITDSCISLGSITPSNFKHNHLNKREGGRNVSVCTYMYYSAIISTGLMSCTNKSKGTMIYSVLNSLQYKINRLFKE